VKLIRKQPFHPDTGINPRVNKDNERFTMLCTVKALKSYRLESVDGEIGKAREFYFDDRHWTIRYLVADTGFWLTGRQVLISPYALVAIDRDIYNLKIKINLTKEQIENSPPLSSDLPVSRQYEKDYFQYFGWPLYWNGPHTWGSYSHVEHDREKWISSTPAPAVWNPHLRSSDEVTGYHIETLDGEIGHVEDFIIDDYTWMIRYLVVSTNNWWPGKMVLVSPHWIERVSWNESKVFINLDRETIRESPEYTEASMITRDYEAELHHHYNRKGYWIDELIAS
jgi:hypothetical protein